MRKLPTYLLLTLSLVAFNTGCDETQLENAQEDYNEEVQETDQAVAEAAQDGVLDNDEMENVAEERRETTEAAGEVAEQQGDLIESKTD